MKTNNRKQFLKAGVLLIAAFLVVSTSAVMANTMNDRLTLVITGTRNGVQESSGPFLLDEEYLGYYDPNTVDDNAIGLQGGQPPYRWESAIRLTQDELMDYHDWNLIGVNFFHHESREHNGMVKIYGEGLPNRPGTLITSEPYSVSEPGWVRVDLTEIVAIEDHDEIWVSVYWESDNNDYPASVDAGPAVKTKGDWIYMNSVWQELYPNGQQFDVNWCMEAIVNEGLTANANGPYYGAIGEDIQFQGEATGGQPPYEWFWKFGDGNTSDEQNPIHAYAEVGFYKVTLTVTDSIGDSDRDKTNATITEFPPLRVDANGPYEGMVGEEIQFTGEATGGTEPYHWLWDFGNGNTSEEQNPLYAYDKAGEFDVTLTVTDSSEPPQDAFDTTSAIITEDSQPKLTIDSISGGKGILVTFKNSGAGDATEVEWSMTIDGGFLILTKEASGSIDTIVAGETKDVEIRVLGIGLGFFTELPVITINVDCLEGSSDETSVDAKIIIFRVTIQ